MADRSIGRPRAAGILAGRTAANQPVTPLPWQRAIRRHRAAYDAHDDGRIAIRRHANRRCRRCRAHAILRGKPGTSAEKRTETRVDRIDRPDAARRQLRNAAQRHRPYAHSSATVRSHRHRRILAALQRGRRSIVDDAWRHHTDFHRLCGLYFRPGALPAQFKPSDMDIHHRGSGTAGRRDAGDRTMDRRADSRPRHRTRVEGT